MPKTEENRRGKKTNPKTKYKPTKKKNTTKMKKQ